MIKSLDNQGKPKYNNRVADKTVTHKIGDWSNGMIGVSKTFGGSSILSSPVSLSVGSLDFTGGPAFFISWDFLTMSPMMSTRNDS